MPIHIAPALRRSLAAFLFVAALSAALPALARTGPSANRSMALQTGISSYRIADGSRLGVFEVGPRLGHVFVFGRHESVLMNFDILTPRVMASKRVHGMRCALELAVGIKAGPLYPGVRVGVGIAIANVDGLEDKYAIHETLSIGLGLTLPVVEWLHLSLRFDHLAAYDALTGNPSLLNVEALTFETIVVLPR